MADGDIPEPNCDLWHAVRALLPAHEGWPPDSETLAKEQAARWRKAKDTFDASLNVVNGIAGKIHQPGGGGTWPDAAGGHMRNFITRANGDEGFRRIGTSMGGIADEYEYYAAVLVSAKTIIKDYVEDLSWQYTALGFDIPSHARRKKADFARNVAENVHQTVIDHAGWVKDPSTRPQPETVSDNYFSGLWKSAVDQGKALLGLFGLGEDCDWSVFNAQVAWGHMTKLLGALALYSMPGDNDRRIDDLVFDGMLGETLDEAGKAFIDYDNWTAEDGANRWHAAGYTTGMVIGLLGPTRGAGAALKLAGKAAHAPKLIQFGDRVGKLTLTHGAIKVIDKLGDTAKPKPGVLPSSVTPEVARAIHDRPGEPTAGGSRGQGAPDPHGPGPAKPPAPQTPHPEALPEPKPPHDGPPPTREPHSPPSGGRGERLLDETPRAPHADPAPVSKVDGPESLRRDPVSSSAEPPAPRHEPSTGAPEPRQPQPRQDAPGGTPSATAADHAPATRADGQHGNSGQHSGQGSEGALTRSSDTPASAPARETPAATAPMHTAAGDAAKRADSPGTERGTPPKPSAEELRRLYEDRNTARLERKFYEDARRDAGDVVYPDHVVKAWSRHMAFSESVRGGHGSPGDAAVRSGRGLQSTEILHNRGAHPETTPPAHGDKGADGNPARNKAPNKHDTPEPNRSEPAPKPNRRMSLDEFARERYPDEYRKAHEDGGGGPRDDGSTGTGGGSPDRPSPVPGPSGSGGAPRSEAARGGVGLLETSPKVAEPAVETVTRPDTAPAAAKARIEAPVRETPRPEPRTAESTPNKPVIQHPEGAPEALPPMTVTPVPREEILPGHGTGPGKPVEPSRMNPGWAEPPRIGRAEPPHVAWGEPPRVGDPASPRVGWEEPPKVGRPAH
ncbi:hypothetical protein DMC63_18580, partial [Streptomyces sp. WAC 05977]